MTSPINQLNKPDLQVALIDLSVIQVGHLCGRAVRKILNNELEFLQSRLYQQESQNQCTLNASKISCSTETKYLLQKIEGIKDCLKKIEDSTMQILLPKDFEFLTILDE